MAALRARAPPVRTGLKPWVAQCPGGTVSGTRLLMLLVRREALGIVYCRAVCVAGEEGKREREKSCCCLRMFSCSCVCLVGRTRGVCKTRQRQLFDCTYFGIRVWFFTTEKYTPSSQLFEIIKFILQNVANICRYKQVFLSIIHQDVAFTEALIPDQTIE